MTANPRVTPAVVEQSVSPPDETAAVGSALSMSPAERRKFIGSSEVASLFGLGRISRFELWHRKAGNLPEEDISGMDRVFWGTTLEPAIAKGAAEREGWAYRKPEFCAHASIAGMGCHPDYEVVDIGTEFIEDVPTASVGLLEVKNVDALVFRDWHDEIPPHIELQLQHQLACTGRTWGAFAILVGGNSLHVVRRDARPVTMRKLGEAVLEFWESIEANREPEPEWEVDLPTLSKLYGHAEPGKLLDLRDHSQANVLAEQYCQLRDQIKALEERQDAAKAQLIAIVGDAERASLQEGRTIGRTFIPGGKTVSFVAKDKRDFRITQKKSFAMVASK